MEQPMEQPKRGRGRPAKAAPREQGKNGMFPVRLLKNYRPQGRHNVIVHADAPQPGVGSGEKLWAGTLVELPLDEAKRLMENKVQQVERHRNVNGDIEFKTIEWAQPVAERADELTI